MEHYYSANRYFRERFGCKVYKIALDGGFTCPNRDGTLDTRGCIFCSGSGSGDFSVSTGDGLPSAVARAKELVSFKNPHGMYIVYFQSFTGTYGPVEKLRDLFTAALSQPEVVALSVGTRPDCLEPEKLALLAELNKRKPVMVELGLQTIHPKTAAYIRRGYDLSVYDDAVSRLNSAGLEAIVHMIIGLPGETPEMIRQTAEYIGRSGADGIKFQLLHVLRGTDLEKAYLQGCFTLPDPEEYIRILENCIRSIPPDMVVHRITGDGAKRDLVAPLWSADKKQVLSIINLAFDRDRLIQGEALL